MPTATELTAESIIVEAAEQTGTDPDALGGEGLRQLVWALDAEAALSPDGRAAVRAALVGCVSTSARLNRLVGEHPEVSTWPIERPVFVTGLLRSGTTLMHNLLAQHPGVRAPVLWELMHPAGPRSHPRGYGPLVEQTQRYLDEYYRLAPTLRGIHLMEARRPDECHRLMATSFESMIYEARYRVPSYAAWLRGRDLTGPYRLHRRQLMAILWRRPGARVVLKCPFHLWSLDALIRVYPDARVVQLHRTPAETIPSTCSLVATMRAARTDRVDRSEIGRQWLDRIAEALGGLQRARVAVPAGQLLDVRYADLLTDPVGTLARVCEFAGIPMTTGAATAMRRYLAGNHAGTHVMHRYRAGDFGLDPAELDRRFAGYREEFRC
jgi:hypothetical protein